MDNDLDPAQNKTLERALMRLFVKGSEGDGALRLNEAETHALAEYVRHLRSQFVQQQQPVAVTVKIDGREVAKAILPHMADTIRSTSGTRNF